MDRPPAGPRSEPVHPGLGWHPLVSGVRPTGVGRPGLSSTDTWGPRHIDGRGRLGGTCRATTGRRRVLWGASVSSSRTSDVPTRAQSGTTT